MQITFPPDWTGRLAGYGSAEPQAIGKSGAGVWRLSGADRAPLFLKSEVIGPFSELPGEIAKLRWLAGTGTPCPEVLADAAHDGRTWLLMTALPGADFASSPLPAETLVVLHADALKRLHALSACPFDQRLDRVLALAEARVAAGIVDEEDFDAERLGQSAERVFADMLALRPQAEDLVVTHGDACSPNLIVHDGQFAGFIDCGRLGLADRYQDLALAARSIASNFGPEWVTPFFNHYGLAAPDENKLAFYRLLDEFF